MANKSPSTSLTCHAVEFQLGHKPNAELLDEASFAGLAELFLFDVGGQYHLLAVWDTEADYRREATAFCAHIGLPGGPVQPVRQGPRHGGGAAKRLGRKIRRSIRRLWAWCRGYASVPFLAEFLVDPAIDLSGLKAKDWKGLLYAQVLVGEQECRLLTFWEDHRMYAAAAGSFGRKVAECSGAAASLSRTGLHRDAKGTAVWSWKLIIATGWAAVATFFVILGYLTQLRDFAASFVVPANVEIPTSSTGYDYTVGDAMELTFLIHNKQPLGSSDVYLNPNAVIEEMENSPPDGVRLGPISITDFPGIKSGGSESAKVNGKALKPGRYRVTVNGHSHSGYVFRDRDLSGYREVTIWPTWGVDHKRVGERCDKRFCVVDADVLVGRDTALEVEAAVIGSSTVEFLEVISSLVVARQKPPPPRRTIHWWFKKLEAKKRYPFKLELSSSADLARGEWETLIKQLQFDFDDKPPPGERSATKPAP
jgi:hypothetical protein